ncbi:MAG TPA: lipopolysaccharide kinase InaA family protein, partial [Gammaproteobacteria bacterium]|nr:lipopolysaccharide kinase InaA family protein [Gammaproteobacteria bacterium]
AIDLKKIALHHPEIFQNKRWRRKIIEIIANYVALLHKNHFMHYDLQWRNILVTKTLIQPQVYLFDMPSGRICKYFFSRMIKRDFFNLYKSAVFFLSRTDQLRFYLLYHSIQRLSAADKIKIKTLIAYYQRKELS